MKSVDAFMDENEIPKAVRDAMCELAKTLRSAAYWARDGYYTTEAEGTANAARREIYAEIADGIDRTFDVDSSLDPIFRR